MKRVFVALGSNLNEPLQQIQTAVLKLSRLPETRWVQVSSFYRSAPAGVTNQPDFINAVAEFYCALEPLQLLTQLLLIEEQQGRVRQQRWGARTLDLDLLLYGDSVLNSEQLTVPHPRLKQRDFVLLPLVEIAPDLILPDGEAVTAALQRCPRSVYLELVNSLPL